MQYSNVQCPNMVSVKQIFLTHLKKKKKKDLSSQALVKPASKKKKSIGEARFSLDFRTVCCQKFSL